jgi:hypothetical protein
MQVEFYISSIVARFQAARIDFTRAVVPIQGRYVRWVTSGGAGRHYTGVSVRNPRRAPERFLPHHRGSGLP